MATAPDKTKVEAYPADRDRLNALAARLTADGPGRFGQAETIRYLLIAREEMAETIAQLMGGERADDLAEQIRDDVRSVTR